MSKIHPTSIISENAIIGKNVEIGPNCLIGNNVKIGSDCKLIGNVQIGRNTTIGKNNYFAFSAVIGTDPQDLKYHGEETNLVIGNNNTFREFVTINRSATMDEETTIGNNNLLMAYVHVAHNCHIKNNTILANTVQLAGHITIDDFAIIGGMTAMHQFVKIGKHAFIGGKSAIKKDVPPFTRGEGMPYRVKGLNSIGLQRKRFSKEQISSIKDVYKLFYQSGINFSEALIKAQKISTPTFEQQEFIQFVKQAERGLSR
ncbi:MAG: acyl-ACP--UDP-N-acetylglucosamine O-acyltransferase [Candidatus Cloacimonadota bacterium]|nr:acyl-ACP--UDP-N-acetylglucosamine O-acyltransferase [Candidatus Cloacimonadota bacterium]